MLASSINICYNIAIISSFSQSIVCIIFAYAHVGEYMKKIISPKDDIKRKHITTEVRDRIIQLLREGSETQGTIANMFGVDQASVSRIKKKYRIGKKAEYSLEECLKHSTVSVPSTFFIQVPEIYRKALADNLLNIYGDTAERYGIIYIEETVKPSGLLIYTLDHNFLQTLSGFGCTIQF